MSVSPGPCCLSALSALPAALLLFSLPLSLLGLRAWRPYIAKNIEQIPLLQPLNCAVQSSEAASGGRRAVGSRPRKRLSWRRALLKTGIPPTTVLGFCLLSR